MLKIAALSGALALALTGVSYAQTTAPSGAPVVNPAVKNNAGTLAPGSASSGGTSSTTGMTGSANGSPTTTPKATTGPAGSASKTETPAR